MKIDIPLSSQIPELRSIWQEAFGDTEEFLDTFEKTAFSPERCRCATVDGKVVAALYWFDCFYRQKRIAYVYAVATTEAYRGQGICHKLMEDTHAHLKDLGYEGVILVPGSDRLFQFYAGIGYEICSHIREFRCQAERGAVLLREIDKKEYAKLRRRFLPEGGVIQENENLDFLETQAKFYVGEGFLLVACRRVDGLLGVELLGDESVAAGIVKALGYAEGTFRTPGEGRPFTMYYSLGDGELPLPTYFGFAFD